MTFGICKSANSVTASESSLVMNTIFMRRQQKYPVTNPNPKEQQVMTSSQLLWFINHQMATEIE